MKNELGIPVTVLIGVRHCTNTSLQQIFCIAIINRTSPFNLVENLDLYQLYQNEKKFRFLSVYVNDLKRKIHKEMNELFLRTYLCHGKTRSPRVIELLLGYKMLHSPFLQVPLERFKSVKMTKVRLKVDLFRAY